MKEVSLRFIQFLDNSESFLAGLLMAIFACILAVCVTTYNIKSDKSLNDARVKIYQIMAERGYVEVQTGGTTATHWEKK